MLGYYLSNSWRSMRRNPALTLLVGTAIALGIGVSITMLTLYYIMASNPIPEKSDVLYRVQVDSWDPIRPFDEDRPERAPHQMTWRDVNNLLDAAAAPEQVGMFTARLILKPDSPEQLPFEVSARVTSSGFFPMFEPPMLYGSGWDKQADRETAQVIVINRELNERLFGGGDSVGSEVQVNGRIFTVVGVMDDWEPIPRFYDVVESGLNEVEEAFIPLSQTPVMEINSAGSDWGWKPETIRTFDDWLASEACWMQYWAYLPDRGQREAYRGHLDAYVMEQKQLGRFERPLNNHIHSVMEWMAYMEVVEEDVSVLVGLGFMFLVVCLLSSISLLLTKFNGRAPEMSLRRALGANRAQIITQNLVEVGLIGAVGGLIGIGLTMMSLYGLESMLPQTPAALFDMDWVMMGTAVSVAVLTSLIAGIYPAIRATAISPAQQLKTQ